jgi:hypothetical protein
MLLSPYKWASVSYLGPLHRCTYIAIFLFVVISLWLHLQIANIESSEKCSDGDKHTSDSSALNIFTIRRDIHLLNIQQLVHNENIFGPLHNDSLIIVVQVRLFSILRMRVILKSVILSGMYTLKLFRLYTKQFYVL